VVSIRAIKHHGQGQDLDAMDRGFENVLAHIENIRNFGYDPVVAINVFPDDSEEELKRLQELLDEVHVAHAVSTVALDGAQGGMALAEAVVEKAHKFTANPRTLMNWRTVLNKRWKRLQRTFTVLRLLSLPVKPRKSLNWWTSLA